MTSVAIIDTTVFLNVLDVPGRNQNRSHVFSCMRELIENNTTLLLPMAAVYETGNHIARLTDGGHRWCFALKFKGEVLKAIDGKAPWQAMTAPTIDLVREWLIGFPDSAKRGAGMGDLSIIKEWENFKKKTPNFRVFIWSLDDHLRAFDHSP